MEGMAVPVGVERSSCGYLKLQFLICKIQSKYLAGGVRIGHNVC